ncbi:iron chelate uptake ABC transporter family permease subunit [Reinekea marinisedimentorum]|uniref:iron chelate uptake ABC transporter family permease subunit n=1 Tax=Reinekea marinisedimentorum TaxID=230495 RepID=UPI001A9F9005|nr:iron chelate uptake ABC transporter family permease subunit [Reinekea marinisedimentorum]
MSFSSTGIRLAILCAFLLVSVTLFLTWNVKASWAFTLEYRGMKLLSLVIVGASISIATLLFQTICGNRILTPGIMGFDSMYILIQTILIFSLGSVGFSSMSPYLKWALETAVMLGCVLLLAWMLFRGTSQSLHYLILVGIIFGVLFTSLSYLFSRMLDPTQFSVLQDSMFASFGSVDPALLLISGFVFTATALFLFRIHAELDVMLLGRQSALNLGVDFSRRTLQTLFVTVVLIALSTALVGPVSFFGLLVAHLTYRLCGSYKHGIMIPFATVLGILTLVSGEFVLQHLLSFQTRLSIIIEFIGGVFFLVLIIRQGKA